MHYGKLINVGCCEDTSPTLIKPTILDEIRDFMKNCAASNVVAAHSEEKTNLDENEISDVLQCLLEYRDKYFSDIPLTNELDKKFMWNIPKSIYRSFKAVRNRGPEFDIVNPMLLFYIFCTEDPGEAMPKFIETICGLIGPEEQNIIEQGSIEYTTNMSDE